MRSSSSSRGGDVELGRRGCRAGGKSHARLRPSVTLPLFPPSSSSGRSTSPTLSSRRLTSCAQCRPAPACAPLHQGRLGPPSLQGRRPVRHQPRPHALPQRPAPGARQGRRRRVHRRASTRSPFLVQKQEADPLAARRPSQDKFEEMLVKERIDLLVVTTVDATHHAFISATPPPARLAPVTTHADRPFLSFLKSLPSSSASRS